MKDYACGQMDDIKLWDGATEAGGLDERSRSQLPIIH